MDNKVYFFDIDKLIEENIENCVNEEIEYYENLDLPEGGVSEELNQRIMKTIADFTNTIETSEENKNIKEIDNVEEVEEIKTVKDIQDVKTSEIDNVINIFEANKNTEINTETETSNTSNVFNSVNEINDTSTEIKKSNTATIKKHSKSKKHFKIGFIAAMLSVIIFATSATLSTYAYSPFREFIINTFSRYFTIDTSDLPPIVENNEPEEFEYKEPKWLPEGEYTKDIAEKTLNCYIIRYDYNSSYIIYQQFFSNDNEIKINNEHENCNIEQFKINNYNCIYINSILTNENKICFNDNVYSYEITTNLDKNTLIKIAENIL